MNFNILCAYLCLDSAFFWWMFLRVHPHMLYQLAWNNISHIKGVKVSLVSMTLLAPDSRCDTICLQINKLLHWQQFNVICVFWGKKVFVNNIWSTNILLYYSRKWCTENAATKIWLKQQFLILAEKVLKGWNCWLVSIFHF